MNTSDRNPMDRVAEEFAQRIRAGEHPTVDEYVQKYPQHADEIRVVLPSVEMLEQLSQKTAAAAHTDTLLAGIKRLGVEPTIRKNQDVMHALTRLTQESSPLG